MSELKPCPFTCADSPRVRRELLGWLVQCPGCWAEGPYCETALQAHEHWNRRAASPAPVVGRTAEEERGYAAATADVVAWLRRWCEVRPSIAGHFADEFEAGKHVGSSKPSGVTGSTKGETP